jgi:maltooligosyltrehalose trehalohydrolase
LDRHPGSGLEHDSGRFAPFIASSYWDLERKKGMKIGARALGNDQYRFTVWAPLLDDVKLHIIAPKKEVYDMQKDNAGYWHVSVDSVTPDTQYQYRLGGEKNRPDPASNLQPDVHGPSGVIDHSAFVWTDTEWQGVPLETMIIYELHVGTFTEESNFAAIIDRLGELTELGINAIELMPVSQFPGSRNWGYDGVYPFAVQNSYGGPAGLKALVNECHSRGIAVILDVVYNHLGPEGNYLADFGPYFTDKYRTPWGDAINFDDAHSPGVRNYFIQNAMYWAEIFHIDALRLDAVHAIYDFGGKHFLQELKEAAEQLSRPFYLIAESDLNDTRLLRPRSHGGYALDGQWSDDFHHAVHALLTGEKDGYYLDFGNVDHLATSLQETFVYSWKYSPFRKRYHGNCAVDLAGSRFVICTQNHDQVGNRMLGERLAQLVDFQTEKLAAGMLLLAPYVPLIFMGQEYGETVPFLYFVSHSDKDLIEAVRKGRQKEFAHFKWDQEPPDPQSAETFQRSILQWHRKENGTHQILYQLYQELIKLRSENAVLKTLRKDLQTITFTDNAIVQERSLGKEKALILYNFAAEPVDLDVNVEGIYKKILDSSDQKWQGPGSTLPESITNQTNIQCPSLCFALFMLEETL